MKKVLVLGNVRPEGLDIVRAFAEIDIIPEPASKPEILARIAEADAVLHKIGKIDRDVMARQTKLKIIARHGVGLDDLDLDCIRTYGIPVTTTGDANSNAVAEATIGLIFSALRHLTRAETMIKRDRIWARESLTGRELRGMTVGVVGYGRIGRLVANYLSAFGCRIVVHDADPSAASRCPHPMLPLDELLATSDIVTLHCPLTASTRHLVSAEALRKAKPGCIIVNTSRGGLVDVGALVAAVEEGRVAGAALDVFDREPPDFDDPVFSCERIVTTPHVAAMTLDAQIAMAVGAATEIRRVLAEGKPPQNNVLA